MNKLKTLIALAILIAVTPARAEVKLASPFTDHMVLQCGMKVPVWGTADAGEMVTVEFAGQKTSTVADTNGNWRLNLKPMKASAESRELIVNGKTSSKKCEDVLVGEVWLASGQSNMDFSLSKKVKYFAGVTNEDAEIAAANYPLIRMFVGDAQKLYAPTNHVGGEWKVCTPENAPAFSAVGYFFARDLQREIKIPVGIIAEAYGASTAEAWIDRETMIADPKLKPMLDHFDAVYQAFMATNIDPAGLKAKFDGYDAEAKKARAEGRTPPRHPRNPDPVQDQHNATVLFNGMIAPIVPYAIRGAIWYQGESILNGDAGIALYPHVQASLVRDWRKLWGERNFPFYIVQLAGQEVASNKPEVREAQAAILALPNTGMAVAMDIGEAKNVHPKNKQDVGDRLARIALAKTYGKKIESSGPTFESMKIEGDKIRVKFLHADGLVARDGNLKWFSIAGADGKFVPADATIKGKSVVVSNPTIPKPVAVRYAWVNFPDGGHLYNSAGLPAAQFRTDAPKLKPVD